MAAAGGQRERAREAAMHSSKSHGDSRNRIMIAASERTEVNLVMVGKTARRCGARKSRID